MKPRYGEAWGLLCLIIHPSSFCLTVSKAKPDGQVGEGLKEGAEVPVILLNLSHSEVTLELFTDLGGLLPYHTLLKENQLAGRRADLRELHLLQ